MKRKNLFRAIADIDDRFITEAIRYAPPSASGSSGRIVHLNKKKIISFALAAVLLLALGVTAFAVFSTYSTRVPESEETFRIKGGPNESSFFDYNDAELVVTFPETEASKQIVFHPGWLPEELSSLNEQQWYDRLTAEHLVSIYASQEGFDGMMQPLLIESYSMSMFNNGGAMLLLDYKPDEIIEEHWNENNVDVLRFHCSMQLGAIPEYNVPEQTLEQDNILISNPEEGWVVRLCGEIGMDELVRVAKNLEIRETGNVLTYDDFESHYTFMDGGVG